MGDYVDFLEPLDPYMERWDPAWEDIHEGFRVWENTYQGTRYSLTMDGDILFTYYNADVYGNPDEQAAFKEKYGYDLAPPATWDQVVDIQEFFRRDTDGDGEIDSWGYSDPIIKRGRGFYSFLLRYINYAGPNPQYMDPETMVPLINNEQRSSTTRRGCRRSRTTSARSSSGLPACCPGSGTRRTPRSCRAGSRPWSTGPMKAS